MRQYAAMSEAAYKNLNEAAFNDEVITELRGALNEKWQAGEKGGRREPSTVLLILEITA